MRRWFGRGRDTGVGDTYVCAVGDAADVARQVGAGLIISISDPELRGKTQGRLAGWKGKVCALDIHDIERAAPGMVMAQAAHIEAAVEAARRMRARDALVVHCHAGVSRSAAVALLASAARLQAAGHSDAAAVEGAFARVLAHAPHVRPNMGILALGVPLLGLEGTDMVERAWARHA